MIRAILCALLAVPLAAQTVIKSIGASGGGGSSITVEEADGAPTGTPTTLQFDQADGFTVTDEGAGVFQVDLGDIAAARMATNWGTAGTSACAETGGVLVDDASTIGCSAGLTYASNKLTVGTAAGAAIGLNRYSVNDRLYIVAGPSLIFDIGSGVWWMDGSSTSSSFWLGGSSGATGLSKSTNALQLYGDSKVLATIGGSQTALFQDPTATTGITSVIVKGGAGQSTTDLMQWQDNAGNVLGSITSDGYGELPAVQLVDPGAKPSCTSDTRGMIWYDAGGAGVADTAEICGKDASDVYAWVAIATF